MKRDIERELIEEGRALREERYPAGLSRPVGKTGTRRRGPLFLPALAATFLIAFLVVRPDRGLRVPPEDPCEREETRVVLVIPPEEAPIGSVSGPICAALIPPLKSGSIRVFLDEREMTSFAEKDENFVILDPPEPVAPGPHLFRLELTGRNGEILGEPSWLIVII